MPTTQDYEFLLECANVIGVDYDEQTERVTVFVSQKVPPDELEPEDDVEQRVEAVDGVDVTVVDSGYGDEREGFDALSILQPVPDAAAGRQTRHRPVPAGVSEIHAESTAATAGPYPARVDDPSVAMWSDSVETGDLVRLSNNHVYALSNEADFGDPIIQPSPQDGGDLPDDETGELVGYVPIEDGVLVDVAARSVDHQQESTTAFELDDSWPTGIKREDYEDLRGETVTKSGRTTGVTSADLEATCASVRVNFGEEHGTVLFRDQLIAGHMSEGGDSGSPAFSEATGELVGLLFAGSGEQTILNKVSNVETELGVSMLTSEPDSGPAESVPVYTTTLETEFDVDIEADHPELSLSSITLEDPPKPGQTIPVTITLDHGGPGEYWLAVNGDRTVFSVAETQADGTPTQRAVTAEVSIPAETTSRVEVHVRGGSIQRP